MSEQQQQQQQQALVEELKQKVVACQQQALAYKRNGDIPSAKQALLESKHWKVQLETALQALLVVEQPQTPTPQTHEEPPEPIVGEEDAMDDVDIPPDKGDGDSGILSYVDEEFNEELTDSPAATSFSLAEMMDIEMIQEFVVSGLPTPTLEEYMSHIESCKRYALEKKQQGNTIEALNHLKDMKRLQAVYKVLEEHQQKNGGNGGMEDDDGETPEELALLRELMMDENQGESDETYGDHTTSNITANVLEMDDLIHMELSEIQDAAEIGMQLPSLSSIQIQINQHKAKAVQLKNDGDLEGAKHALQTFKLWSQQYKYIETVNLQQQQQTGLLGNQTLEQEDVRDEDLAQLLENEEEKPVPTQAQPVAAAVPKIKSSDEWKQDAIRLRDEKKIEEATRVLIQYKLALAREEEERELHARHEHIERLRRGLDLAQTQYLRFILWEKLVDSASGTQQQHAWLRYMELCTNAVDVIQTRGTQAVTITAPVPPAGGGSLRCLPDDLSELVYWGTDPTEERVEVSMFDMIDLHTNKCLAALQKSTSCAGGSTGFQWVKFGVHVCIQLPSTEHDTETPVDVRFHSKAVELSSFMQEGERKRCQANLPRKRLRTELVSTTTNLQQESSQYVTFERGDSAFAKMLVRRMERRKITISVSCHAVDDPNDPTIGKRKGWFGGGKKRNEENPKEPISLGKFVLDTKYLLHNCPCIVGEYPLQGTGKREVGGRLRICIRTGIPFGTTFRATTEKAVSVATLPLYPNLAFAFSSVSHDGTMGNSAVGSK